MCAMRQQSVPVKMEPDYEHQASDLVDVYPNEDGEFVQVWDSAEHEWVVLSYQRTPFGTKDICRTDLLSEGPWARIDHLQDSRVFWYREPPQEGCLDDIGWPYPDDVIQHLFFKRVEYDLPNGQMLISDPRSGMVLEQIWTAGFDSVAMVPTGRRLGHRAIERLRDAGTTYYLTTYQCCVQNGAVQRTGLASVQSFAGGVGGTPQVV